MKKTKVAFRRFDIVKFDEKNSPARAKVLEINEQINRLYKESEKAHRDRNAEHRAWAREQNVKVRAQLKSAPKYQIYPVYRPYMDPTYRIKGLDQYVYNSYKHAVSARDDVMADTPKGCDAFKNELKALLRKYNKDSV